MCFSELKAGVLKAGVEVVSIDVGKHCICCRSREVVWKWVVSKLSFFSRDTFAQYVAFDHLIIYICPALSIWPALSGMIRWVEAAMASSVYTCFGGNIEWGCLTTAWRATHIWDRNPNLTNFLWSHPWFSQALLFCHLPCAVSSVWDGICLVLTNRLKGKLSSSKTGKCVIWFPKWVGVGVAPFTPVMTWFAH